MPDACSVMFRWQSCQSSSSTLPTSSMLSFVRCRFTLGCRRANVKLLSVNTRPFMNDSGGRFALAWSPLSSRHGAARMTLQANRLLSVILFGSATRGEHDELLSPAALQVVDGVQMQCAC